MRQEYEEKIKGLMPVELRQELEDTIASLKAQVRADWVTGSDRTLAGTTRHIPAALKLSRF